MRALTYKNGTNRGYSVMSRKIAVLADIHSNHIALETCLEVARARHAEAFLFLGDYLGEMAYPEKTLAILKQTAGQYPCEFIRGNKEEYWIRRNRGEGNRHWRSGTSGSGILMYVYEHLTPEDIAWFAGMPIAKTVRFPGLPPFVICHGSPWKVEESLREDYAYIDERTAQLGTELTVCAHFHIQSAYTRHGRRVVNPGAVGVPLRSGGLTQFMMLRSKDGQWSTEFISLPYDVERAIREMDAEKLNVQAPGWYRVTKEVLRGGKTTHMTVLTRAHDLYERETGTDDWACIPERYWERALAELGIPE